MANLTSLRVCNSFTGLDARPGAPEGTLRAMENLSAERYPLLSARRPRGRVRAAGALLGLIRLHVMLDGALQDALCAVTADRLIFLYGIGPETVSAAELPATFSSAPKQLVTMGTRLLIFPDKKLLDVQTLALTSLPASVPDMDFVCESGNRLWGCRYGEVNGSLINELYASALNDPGDFTTFEGIATDAWRASCGSDGPFTGCITYEGNPVFFKERSVTRIYSSGTGAHRAVTSDLPGVQRGSAASLVAAGDRLLYKGVNGIYAWDGAAPVRLSDRLGDTPMKEASAGMWKDTLYVSMLEDRVPGRRQLFTYDTARGSWCREDSVNAAFFTEWQGELFFLDLTAGEIRCVNGERFHPLGTEASVAWYMETPVLLCEGGENKRIEEYGYRLRVSPAAGATVTLAAEYDSGGAWETLGTLTGTREGIYEIRAVPHPCDHLRLRLSGSGPMTLWSVSRMRRKEE